MEETIGIRFACDDEYEGVFDTPVSASKILPNYYKQMPSLVEGSKPVFNESGDPSETMKKCMPVFDAMTAGYLITLVTDVYVENHEQHGKKFTWPADNFAAVSSHPDGQFPGLPIPDGYDTVSAYKFNNPWQVVTQQGYSCLFVHPMWHYDLPFHVFPGVIDTDKHPVSVNFPFLMQKEFEGYLRKGTPIAQVIPFRREEFVASSGVRDSEDEKAWRRARLQFSNRYKEHFRSLKSFR